MLHNLHDYGYVSLYKHLHLHNFHHPPKSNNNRKKLKGEVEMGLLGSVVKNICFLKGVGHHLTCFTWGKRNNRFPFMHVSPSIPPPHPTQSWLYTGGIFWKRGCKNRLMVWKIKNARTSTKVQTFTRLLLNSEKWNKTFKDRLMLRYLS